MIGVEHQAQSWPGDNGVDHAPEQQSRIRATWIKAGAISMQHMRHAATATREDTAAMARGRAAHMAILEPARYETAVAVWRGGIRRGKAWDDFQAAHAGREILREEDALDVQAMAAAVRAHAGARAALAGIRAEVALEWSSPEYGTACARLDGIAGPAGAQILVEYKTTVAATPRDFLRQFFNMGYHLQLGWYAEGCARLGAPVSRVVVVAQTKDAPHCVMCYTVEAGVIEAGRRMAIEIARQYRACEKSGIYPGPMDGSEDEAGVMLLSLPSYMEEVQI